MVLNWHRTRDRHPESDPSQTVTDIVLKLNLSYRFVW
jgi:hypothetical protein